MVEKIGHIKNPLTVIAVFAAIAEISGTTILPFIAQENQATYIWFLMLFPALLVGLFFLTLNFNHKVLYAPSDWKDETNFFRLFSKATPEEQERKLKEEVTEETKAEEAVQGTVQTQSKSEEERRAVVAASNRERAARYSLAERLVISRLSKQLNLNFRSGVRFHSGSHRSVIFDAVAFDGNRVNAVEVKLSRSSVVMLDRAEAFLMEAERVANRLREEGKELVLHFALVLDGDAVDNTKLEASLRRLQDRFELNIKFHLFSMTELASEFENHLQ